MKNEYSEISNSIWKLAHGNAWSLESMDAHGAADRGIVYIGSKVCGYLENKNRDVQLVRDYYQDTEGMYWFKNRALIPSGEMISMEKYLLGHEVKTRRHKN